MPLLSKFRCPEGDDHPDAAGKHLLDALTLKENGRFDGAAYLSGYVIECSLKTLIILQTKKSIRGHKLDELSKRVLELARLPTSKTAKYNKVISRIGVSNIILFFIFVPPLITLFRRQVNSKECSSSNVLSPAIQTLFYIIQINRINHVLFCDMM